MGDRGVLAEQFELTRPHLTSVAYAMLGSVGDAEDAVQEAWLRLDRSDAGTIEDLRGWLTTVVGRICLDVLRARKRQPVDPVGTSLPEPLVDEAADRGPEHEAVLADSVGLALLVVLDSLSPAERLAFVLHDVFALPFEEVARIVDRTPENARQLASRARRRVQDAPTPDRDLAVQRRVVDAFLAAAREGDFAALLAVLDPDVVLRIDVGPEHPQPAFTGAEAVARRVLASAPRFAAFSHPVLVNGSAGALVGTREHPISVVGFTVANSRIASIDIVADRAKLRHLRLR